MATNYGTKTRILLGGSAGKLFGREHVYELSTGDTREAVKAIDVNHPGFAKYLADAKMKGLEFAIFRNRKNIGEQELKMGGAKEIRIVPVIAGSKRAGLLQTILGVALIVMSPFTNGATLAPGIALAAGGCDPDAQPAGNRTEAKCLTRELSVLRLRQRQEHHCQRQPGTDLHRRTSVGWNDHLSLGPG